MGTLGGGTSDASAINNSDAITGTAETKTGVDHAALWLHGKVKDLGTLGGKTSYGAAINARNDVVGLSDHKGCCTTHATLWPHDRAAPVDLNADIGSTESRKITLVEAIGINDHCAILALGYRHTDYRPQSYVLTPTHKSKSGSCSPGVE